jgi:5-methylcytosine-specific restriction endonuclease McrA
LKKKDRQLIYDKYGGRCAYCGDPLQKGWHVDEIEPVKRGWEYVLDTSGNRVYDEENQRWKTIPTIQHPERLTISNQNPACPSCNINKHSGSLEDFRAAIKQFVQSLNRYNVQYKVAKRYGLIQETQNEVIFYFETLNAGNGTK